jgi:hypothetical protein
MYFDRRRLDRNTPIGNNKGSGDYLSAICCPVIDSRHVTLFRFAMVPPVTNA